MFQTLFNWVHSCIDTLLSWCKLVQNREVGWLTVDRKTGKYKREQMPIKKKMKLLLLFNPITEWIDLTKHFRHHLHAKSIRARKREMNPKSKSEIKAFVDAYNINMDEFIPHNIDEYPSFEEFFTRKHDPKSRPIFEEDDPSSAIVVADCRLVVFPTLSLATKLWIKGRNFTLSNLLQESSSSPILSRWKNGAAIGSFRLSPQDYHRYQSPVTGTVKWWKHIPGTYYQVDPLCLRSDIDILCMNARCVLCIETEEYGEVLFVAIGAEDVGTVSFNDEVKTPGNPIKKGQEVGRFEFGGSSIIVAFEPDRIEFDEDLLKVSQQKIMMDVEVGMSLGRLKHRKEAE